VWISASRAAPIDISHEHVWESVEDSLVALYSDEIVFAASLR
jgi:hypothetical protein